MTPSNLDVSAVRSQVRSSATASFEFLAGTVLGYHFSSELCKCVQDVVDDQEDFVIRTNTPKSVASALQAWLRSKGVLVLSTLQLPEHEILAWLEFNEVESSTSFAVSLDIRPEGVALQWL